MLRERGDASDFVYTPLLALEPLYRRAQAWEELAELYRTMAGTLTDITARVVMMEQLAILQELHGVGDPADTRKTLLQILELDPTNRAALAGLERIALAEPVVQRVVAQLKVGLQLY